MSLSVKIEKQLGNFRLNVDLETGDDVLSLLGASGCGKSMTLKCIAGIVRPDRGRIEVDGRVLFDSQKRIDLTPQQRRTGLMFQNYALFPNMTVSRNILCGTKRDSSADGGRMTSEIMDRFNLTPLADLYPSQLSGGQQQRVALARILVSKPDILLLDEPFSALDSHLRFQLEREVRGIIKDFGRTVVLVSHDRDEVFRMSDRIAVMNAGTVDVFGDKDAVFADPKTTAAAILTGCKNISPMRILDEHRVLAEDWGLELRTDASAQGCGHIGIRMHDIVLGEGENSFLMKVTEVIENPFSYTVMLRSPDRPEASSLGWEIDKELWTQIKADTVRVSLPADKLLALRQ